MTGEVTFPLSRGGRAGWRERGTGGEGSARPIVLLSLRVQRRADSPGDRRPGSRHRRRDRARELVARRAGGEPGFFEERALRALPVERGAAARSGAEGDRQL